MDIVYSTWAAQMVDLLGTVLPKDTIEAISTEYGLVTSEKSEEIINKFELADYDIERDGNFTIVHSSDLGCGLCFFADKTDNGDITVNFFGDM